MFEKAELKGYEYTAHFIGEYHQGQTIDHQHPDVKPEDLPYQQVYFWTGSGLIVNSDLDNLKTSGSIKSCEFFHFETRAFPLTINPDFILSFQEALTYYGQRNPQVDEGLWPELRPKSQEYYYQQFLYEMRKLVRQTGDPIPVVRLKNMPDFTKTRPECFYLPGSITAST